VSSHEVHIRAYAKVNTYLNVVRRRPDGYHDLETEMRAIGISDVLSFEHRDDDHIALQVEPADPRLLGDDNLVVRAASLLRDETGCRDGVTMHLLKRIPIEAGLGGGSSDGAAALHALNSLWNLKLDRPSLARLGGRLGSDVPFFVYDCGAARCTGRGDHVEPMSTERRRGVVLVSPRVAISTRLVFQELDPSDYPIGRSANALQGPAERLFPIISETRRALLRATSHEFALSGSGPTLFAWIDEATERRRVVTIARRLGLRGWSTTTMRYSARMTSPREGRAWEASQ